MRSRLGLAAFCFLLTVPFAARAQWQANGAVVCNATNAQSGAVAVPDGAGGIIIVWSDGRSVSKDIYAQRFDNTGHPQWTANGIALCTATGDQITPVIVSDGSGGVIAVWADYRGGATSDIYAQRANAAGAVQWTANGVAVSTATDNQLLPAVTPTASGGAFVAWEDYRDYALNFRDLYGARLTSTGVVSDPAGILISNASNDQVFPALSPFGTGGAVIVWQDFRTPNTNADIYAARVSGGGTLLDVLGLGICKNSAVQGYPTTVADGSGGAVLIWSDYRQIEGIYAQRVNSTGGALWTGGGVIISTTLSGPYLQAPRAWGDGAGGATIAWTSAAGADYQLYSQRIDGNGAPQWLPNEIVVSNASLSQMNSSMVPDGSGGFIHAWMDDRDSQDVFDIYAQRVNSSGIPMWTEDGIVVCDAANDQSFPCIVSDGAAGAIVAWTDSRSDGSGAQDDIYAQRVISSGGPVTPVEPTTPSASFSVRPPEPNPFSHTTTFELQMGARSDVTVEVFDVAGVRVRTLKDYNGSLSRRITFDGRDDSGRNLPTGLYFARVTALGSTHTVKMVLLR